MDNFKIQSIYIGEKCDEKYCKVLKRGCEYKFYSDNLTEEINLYGDNINICALVGKNGSGKSSLLDILYRLANNFGYLLFRGVVMPGAETPKYLKQIYASIKFKLNETYLELKCEDTKMYLKENSDIVWYDEYSGEPINNNAEGKLKGDFDAFTSSDKDNKIIKTASKFFYTIVTNYSIQSFNYDDYEDEGEWLHNVFHKNDGYSHPIVLNPFRTTSGIDIENEGELTNYRLSAILLKDQGIIKENKEKKSFIDGYHLKRLEYHYSPFKYYSNIFDSLKDGDSEKEEHKEDDASSLIKFINGKFLEAFKIKGSCTNLILNKFISNLQLSDESPLSFKTACVYLVYKVLSSTKYPGYAKYFSHYHKYEKCLDANPVNSDFENFLEEIKSDQSHIANKLNQTIQFINEYKELEERIGTPPLNDENSMFNFLSYIGERKLPNNITDIMRELPPPFFKVKILLCKKSQQNKEEEEIAFNKLSSGEKQFAYMMSTYIYHLANLESITPKKTEISLHSETGRVNYRMINLVFDEMELCFHPEYQRTFVNNLISYIQRMELNKTFSFNIILTTHSPFILSDIPACNILALKDGEPDELFKNEKTLAANIYDILNNGFFMSNFIGEFSSRLLGEIITKLNTCNVISLEQQEILYKQISLIGDDFVHIKLLEKLDLRTNNRFSIEARKKKLNDELDKLSKL